MLRTIVSGFLVLIAAPAAADNVAGQRLFLRCQTCHEVKAGASPRVGPTLHGIFGRKAGSLPDYAYSESLGKSSIVWTDATLDQWITKPSALIPGTKMGFAGLPKAEDRAALIAYLKQVTK